MAIAVLKELRRDRALGIPVLHVGADELDHPGIVTRILRWAYEQLQSAA